MSIDFLTSANLPPTAKKLIRLQLSSMALIEAWYHKIDQVSGKYYIKVTKPGKENSNYLLAATLTECWDTITTVVEMDTWMSMEPEYVNPELLSFLSGAYLAEVHRLNLNGSERAKKWQAVLK